MTKLRIISDTHFDRGLNASEEYDTNHSSFYEHFYEELQKEKDCVTLIAGDLAASMLQTEAFLETFFPTQKVIFVSGNHICYNHENKTLPQLKQEYLEKFPKTHLFWHFLENDWMYIPNTNNTVAIIGSELYTDYEYSNQTVESYNARMESYNNLALLSGYAHLVTPHKPIKRLTKKRIIANNKIEGEFLLNDFRYGKISENRVLSANDYLDLHKKAKIKIVECYEEIMKANPTTKVILMTHHCLSSKCISERYKDHATNASYVSELEDWVVENLPNTRLVISGHVHTTSDFTFGDGKRYVVNPCGYIRRGEPFREDKPFNPNFIIDTETL